MVKDLTIIHKIFEVPTPLNYSTWYNNIDSMQMRNQYIHVGRQSLRHDQVADQLPNKSPLKYRISPLKQELNSPTRKFSKPSIVNVKNKNSPQKYFVEKRNNHVSKLEQLQEKYLNRTAKDRKPSSKKPSVPPPPPPPAPHPTATATYASRRHKDHTPPHVSKRRSTGLASRPLPKILRKHSNSHHKKAKRWNPEQSSLALDTSPVVGQTKGKMNKAKYGSKSIYSDIMTDDISDDEYDNNEQYYSAYYQNHAAFNPRQGGLMQKDRVVHDSVLPAIRSFSPTDDCASTNANYISSSVMDSNSTTNVANTKKKSMCIQIPRVTSL